MSFLGKLFLTVLILSLVAALVVYRFWNDYFYQFFLDYYYTPQQQQQQHQRDQSVQAHDYTSCFEMTGDEEDNHSFQDPETSLRNMRLQPTEMSTTTTLLIPSSTATTTATNAAANANANAATTTTTMGNNNTSSLTRSVAGTSHTIPSTTTTTTTTTTSPSLTAPLVVLQAALNQRMEG